MSFSLFLHTLRFFLISMYISKIANIRNRQVYKAILGPTELNILRSREKLYLEHTCKLYWLILGYSLRGRVYAFGTMNLGSGLFWSRFILNSRFDMNFFVERNRSFNPLIVYSFPQLRHKEELNFGAAQKRGARSDLTSNLVIARLCLALMSTNPHILEI